ncbi:hypothetical protein F5884DRAFT_794039, partial [Xylogone sp. PMI_703]
MQGQHWPPTQETADTLGAALPTDTPLLFWLFLLFLAPSRSSLLVAGFWILSPSLPGRSDAPNRWRAGEWWRGGGCPDFT